MKYYVISDTHGFLPQTEMALRERGFFEDTEKHKLVLCGDLLDRGNYAKEMQDFMLDLLHKDELIFIRGNHEDLMLSMINEIEESYSNGYTYVKNHHIHNGTYHSAKKLTECVDSDLMRDPLDFLYKLRSTPFVNELIPASVDYYETKRYIFVHGWIPAFTNDWKESFEYDPDWRRADRYRWQVARWYNGMDLAEDWGVKEPGKTIICGHWHASYGHCFYENKGSEFASDAIFTPYRGDGIIAIDGCTAHSGIVNCLVFEDEEI